MYGVMSGEVSASTTYLKNIWGTKLFKLEVQNYKDSGRFDIVQNWNSIQIENSQRITNLEKAAKLHPYSPELYYNLFLLYSENGEKEKAATYLKKARQIDPSI